MLSIDHFNKPWGTGRAEAVLILLDHAFEMLLKGAIRHRGGAIRKPRDKFTLGFDACVRKAHTDGRVRFLNHEQVLTLQAINGQRDAAQHYLVDLSEHQLYFYAQAGVTLFRDIHDNVFPTPLIIDLPERVLPVSTTAPRDLAALFDKEIREIRELLIPGKRRRLDAIAKVRSLAVLEGAVNGDYEQPSAGVLSKLCDRIINEPDWNAVFPGVSSINISSQGEGFSIQLRLCKKEGVPVQIVKSGEGTGVLAIQKVDNLGFYSLGFDEVQKKLSMGRHEVLSLIWKLSIQDDPACFKVFKIGGSKHKRYSPKAVEKIRNGASSLDLRETCRQYSRRGKAS